MMNDLASEIRESFNKDFSLALLKVLIIGWAFFIIGLALAINDKWVLAGILAYEVLP